MRRHVIMALSTALLLVSSTGAEMTFTRVADTSTLIPGGMGAFTAFATPAIDAGHVMFAADGYLQHGLYGYQNESLGVVVDQQTLVPGTESYFYEAIGPSLDGDHYGFQGYGAGQTGAYSSLGGLHAVVRTGTALETPVGLRYITSVGAPSIAGTDVVTNINCGDYVAVRLSTPAGTQIVADNAPGSMFTNVGGVALGNGNTALLGYGAFGGGIFRTSSGEITPLVLGGDSAPGWSGRFHAFTCLTARQDDIAFVGDSEDELSERSGVYAYRDGALGLVADSGTRAPGTDLLFDDFHNYGEPCVDVGNVAFAAAGTGFNGLFIQYQGELQTVLTNADTLDGKRLRYMAVGPYGLSGDDLAFVALFDDLSSGVYVAHIPEPATALIVLAAAALHLPRRLGVR